MKLRAISAAQWIMMIGAFFQSIFRDLDTQWGPHTVDRFASYYNTQFPQFNSQFWNPGSEAVDAFNSNWLGDNNWL